MVKQKSWKFWIGLIMFCFALLVLICVTSLYATLGISELFGLGMLGLLPFVGPIMFMVVGAIMMYVEK